MNEKHSPPTHKVSLEQVFKGISRKQVKTKEKTRSNSKSTKIHYVNASSLLPFNLKAVFMDKINYNISLNFFSRNQNTCLDFKAFKWCLSLLKVVTICSLDASSAYDSCILDILILYGVWKKSGWQRPFMGVKAFKNNSGIVNISLIIWGDSATAVWGWDVFIHSSRMMLKGKTDESSYVNT